MIKVIFAPGSYGTFLTSCLYKLTDLNQSSDRELVFDQKGSSHHNRDNINSSQVIRCGHLELKIDSNDQVVVIVPHEDHKLDYYDNQFTKQENSDVISYILGQVNQTVINDKLLSHWKVHGLCANTPTWVVREWCSFWIQSCLDNGYDIESYKNLPACVHISTVDITENLVRTLAFLFDKLNLRAQVDTSTLIELQDRFIRNQKFNNMQIKCQQWINDTVQGFDSMSPCQTVFDESFVQHLLRLRGYEILCDGLNSFPTTASDLGRLIYKSDENR